VTIMATFIGYQAGGLLGALAATAGMFTAPTILAALAAAGVERLAKNRWLKAFGRGAAPAVVGLLGATAWNVARHSVTSWPLALVALLALIIAARTKAQPIYILCGGAALGGIIAAAGF
ncbi:chromate transporter, partial [Armatimonas sp.]|uniref:chromate transporter n=1 Tax=Armatimonas sp. TaxID=1872638 RepID=UPI003753CC93